ncbi:MAG: DUF4129 domain-containing protein, partial [Pseudomonadota bacterium]
LLAMAVRQAFIQATGLFILPLMFVLAAPFPWFYAFYANAGVLDEEGDQGVKNLAGEAWRQACLWPFHNHVLLTVLFVFGLFVLLNLAAFVYSLPAMARMFFGVQSPALSAALSPFTVDFWLVCLSLAYLALDPLVKAAYAVRCFQGLSRRTGEDLLARARRAFGVVALLAAAACLAGALAPAPAQASDGPGYARDLEESVRKVLDQPRFSWRLPLGKEVKPEKPPGFWAGVLDWTARQLKAAVKKVARWIKAAWKWIRKLFPDPKKNRTPAGPGTGAWRGWGYLLAGLVILASGILILRHLRRSLPATETAGGADLVSLVDVRDESVSAGDLPPDQWRDLALSLLSLGRETEALRALYLGAVAGLGGRELLLVARHKSNRDYLRELSLRAAALPDIVDGFAFQTEVFERTWYGGRTPTEPEVQRFLDLHGRMAGHGA